MYAQLDADFTDNPKILGTSLAALGVYALGLAYAVRHLTDGYLPAVVVTYLCRGEWQLVAELETQRLWERGNGSDYRIHDFLEHNLSANDVKAGRKAARERMRRFRRSSREQMPNERGTNAEVPILAMGAAPPSRAVRQNLRSRSKSSPTNPRPAAKATSKAHAESFARFWEAYPPRRGRRDKKADAWKAWQKLAPDATLEATILAAVARYARADTLPVDAVRYLTHRRWEDETEVAYVAPRVPKPTSVAAMIPDAKPARSPEAVEQVKQLVADLPFMRGK
jgi:hypothetical protein